MRTKPFLQKATVSLCLGACLCSAALAQANSPTGLADGFVRAWSKHDMKAFGHLFSEDAIWVPLAEQMDRGRAAILKDLAAAHSTWAGQTTMARTAITTQVLRPDVQVLFFHVQFLVNGKKVEGIDRAFIMVAAKKKGQWQIASGQLTKQHDGE